MQQSYIQITTPKTVENQLLLSQSCYDTVCILNFPKIGLNNPPMGPAILQSISVNMKADTRFIDVNLMFHEYFEQHKFAKEIINDWCELDITPTPDQLIELEQFICELDCEYIFSADIVAISVFSIHSCNFTKWFLETYKLQIQGKIIVGGAGAAADNFGKNLHNQGLVDYYVLGEGEYPFRAILSDTLPYPGVNSPSKTLPDFSAVPIPNYSGYQLDKYINSKSHGRTLGVEGSRGCVRNCTFCDIHDFWDRYKFKNGVALAEELIILKKQYAVKHFFFNDSLVNGSDRAFREFIFALAEYNNTVKEKITWSGYFIIKSANTYKEQDWITLKKSGAQSLFIGIESGSESVRNHMKKKFSNHDIESTMKKLQLYGIRCTWLIIIGYPTETEEDFQQTLELFKTYQPMALDRTIDTVGLGMTLDIITDSPLDRIRDELHIVSSVDGDARTGVYWKNQNSDFKIRVRRRIEAELLIRKLGYNSWVGDNDTIAYFEKKLAQLEQNIVVFDDFAAHHG